MFSREINDLPKRSLEDFDAVYIDTTNGGLTLKPKMLTDEEEREAVAQMQANASHPKMHTVTRNGRIYDRLCPDTHHTIQITRSYACDMSGRWRLWNENVEMIAEF